MIETRLFDARDAEALDKAMAPLRNVGLICMPFIALAAFFGFYSEPHDVLWRIAALLLLGGLAEPVLRYVVAASLRDPLNRGLTVGIRLRFADDGVEHWSEAGIRNYYPWSSLAFVPAKDALGLRYVGMQIVVRCEVFQSEEDFRQAQELARAKCAAKRTSG